MAGFSIVGLAASFAAVLIPHVAAQCSGVAAARYQPKLASGIKSSVLASGLRGPRGIAFDTEGNLLVAEQTGGNLLRIVLKESGDTVCVESSKSLVTGGATNHAVAVSADGKTLFLSNMNAVTAYSYDPVAGTVGTGKQIITGMGPAGSHPTRALLTPKTNPDMLLVARGSSQNIDTTAGTQGSGRSMIKAFSIKAVMASPVAYASGGEILGWGMRNIVGMGEEPVHGGIFSVENSLDDMRLGGRDVHNDNPAEKLNYHGVMNDTSNKLKGANFGYPSCFAVWDSASVSNQAVGSLINPDGVPKASDCASRQLPSTVFHAHTAPLDIKWNNAATTAYISFHGSWDRNPPDGYRVMKVDFKNGLPSSPVSSKTASTAVMENSNTRSCPNACFRPVGLAVDKKDRLFVSSDTSGEIFVLYNA